MKDLIKSIDNLPKLIKLILAIPALDIIWVVYLLMRSFVKNNMLGVVIAVVLIIASLIKNLMKYLNHDINQI